MKKTLVGFLILITPLVFAQEKTKQEMLWQKMVSRLDDIIQKHDGVMGVAVLDLTNKQMLTRNADQVFPTASSIKLPLMLELYRQEERGRNGEQGVARLQDLYTFNPKDLAEDSQIMAGLTPGITKVTNRDLAQFVVAVSDNSAANVLIDRVGMENVNRMLKELGIEGIQLRRKMMDLQAARQGKENVATPKAMVELLEKIQNESILNQELKEDFIRLFCTSKESYIPRYLSSDVRVANKPGSLDAVRTDSGIVFATNRPFAISVMTAYDREELAAELAIGEVALAAFQYFDMIGRASEYGRIILPEANPK
jgi:beta-lactamase class A